VRTSGDEAGNAPDPAVVTGLTGRLDKEEGRPGHPARRAARERPCPPARNPGTEFTPHQVHNVLGNSSGAIANALDTLVKLGDAELACEKPRRFRLAARFSQPGEG
jgi:hypothetical protein